MFYGTGVAIVTPFLADGQVDYSGLKAVINHLVEGEIDYIVSLGTTGEAATLTNDEKRKVWEFTAETVNKRIKLVAGIGGNNTIEVVKETAAFNIEGYDAILSASPHYNKPTQEGIYQHYRAIAENAALPIILYNVPSRTGSTVSAETTVKLAHEFKNIIATKEASGSFEIFNQIMRDKPEDFLLISGDDPVTLPMIALGASGLISVAGNALPKQVATYVKQGLAGDFKAAREGHSALIEFTRLLFIEGSPAGVKNALKQLNICGDTVRLPLVNVSAGTEAAIATELRKLDSLR